MADSKLRDLSIDFAVKVIEMCDKIKGHYSLVNQLERSSTSIGANIHEAKPKSRSDHITSPRKKHTFVYQTNVCFFQRNLPCGQVK